MTQGQSFTTLDVAIIGITGQFPGAVNLDELWKTLSAGETPICADCNHSEPFCARCESAKIFDPDFFALTLDEAKIIDPQQRLFLTHSLYALELAGYNPDSFLGNISVFAGAGPNTYLYNNIHPNYSPGNATQEHQLNLGNDIGYLATRVAYHLNLKGACFSVQAACSSALIAVHQACQSLIYGECELALAGGVSVKSLKTEDDSGPLTTIKSGVGIVVLKLLRDAEHDGDTIHAVIKGTATNNSGSVQGGFGKPNKEGLVRVVSEAYTVANINPETIQYIETYGANDDDVSAIELSALQQAFGLSESSAPCAVGTIKRNAQSLDAVLGMTSFLKTVLMLKHKTFVSSEIQDTTDNAVAKSDVFYKVDEVTPWEQSGVPRRAAVNVFGCGGTNAHIVLEEYPKPKKEAANQAPLRKQYLVTLSAKSLEGLRCVLSNMSDYLNAKPNESIDDIIYTLNVGRRNYNYRYAFTCANVGEFKLALNYKKNLSKHVITPTIEKELVFIFAPYCQAFSEQGAALYKNEEEFRGCFDTCAELLRTHLGYNPIDELYSCNKTEGNALSQLLFNETAVAVFECALARLYISWGVSPSKIIGFGVGEYVAAHIAGCISLESMLALALARDGVISLTDAIQSIKVSAPCTHLLSGVNGQVQTLDSISNGAYWVETQLDDGYTVEGVNACLDINNGVFLEFALAPAIKRYIAGAEVDDPTTPIELDVESALLPHPILMEDNVEYRPENNVFDLPYALNVLGRLWLRGFNINWPSFYAGENRCRVELPVYPLNNTVVWLDEPAPRRIHNIPSNIKTSTAAKASSTLIHDAIDSVSVEVVTPQKAADDNKVVLVTTEKTQQRKNVTVHNVGSAAKAVEGVKDPEAEVSSPKKMVGRIPLRLKAATLYIKNGAALLSGCAHKNVLLSKDWLNNNLTLQDALKLSQAIKRDLGSDFMPSEVLSAKSLQSLARHLAVQYANSIDNLLVDKNTFKACLQNFLPKLERIPDVVPGDGFPVAMQYASGYEGGNTPLTPPHHYMEVNVADMHLSQLNQAWQALVLMHPMLRVELNANGEQFIHSVAPPYVFRLFDVRRKSFAEQDEFLNTLRERMSHNAYPLGRWPLYEICISICEGKKTLHISMSGYVTDLTSLHSLLEQWWYLYEKNEVKLSAPENHYSDFIIGQMRAKQSTLYLQAQAYWEKKQSALPDGPAFPLCETYSASTFDASNAVCVRASIALERRHWTPLKKRLQAEGVTPSAFMLCVFSQVLGVYSQNDRFALLLASENRAFYSGLERLVGPMATNVVLAIDTLANTNFITASKLVQQKMLDALMYGCVTPESTAQARDEAGCCSTVQFSSLQDCKFVSSDQTLMGRRVYGVNVFPNVFLSHTDYEVNGSLKIDWDVVEGVYAEGLINEMLSQFRQTLQMLATDLGDFHLARWDISALWPKRKYQFLGLQDGNTLSVEEKKAKNKASEVTYPGRQSIGVHSVTDQSFSLEPSAIGTGKHASGTSAENDFGEPSDPWRLRVFAKQRLQAFPLTAQQAVLSECRAGAKHTHIYKVFNVFNLDVNRLEQALQKLMDSYDVLTLLIKPDGTQQCLPDVPPYSIKVTDALRNRVRGDELPVSMEASMRARILSFGGWPNFDVQVIHTDKNVSDVHFCIDRIIADEESAKVLSERLFYFYANPLAHAHLSKYTFADYVNTHNSLKNTPAYNKEHDYWYKQAKNIDGAPMLPMSAEVTEDGVVSTATLELTNNRALKSICVNRLHASIQNLQALKATAKKWGVSIDSLIITAYAGALNSASKKPKFTIAVQPDFHVQANSSEARLAGAFSSLQWLSVDMEEGNFVACARKHNKTLLANATHNHIDTLEVLKSASANFVSAKSSLSYMYRVSQPLRLLNLPENIKLCKNVTMPPGVLILVSSVESGATLNVYWDVLDGVFDGEITKKMFKVFEALIQRCVKFGMPSDAKSSEAKASSAPVGVS